MHPAVRQIVLFGGGWSPAKLFLAGQQGAWYDPSDMGSMFTDTAGTTPVAADGDLVARINDKSGNGYHLLQATSTKRPLFKVSGAQRWLESDGIDDFMQVAISGWTDLTAVIANAILQDGTGPIGIEIAAATRADTLFQMNAPSNNGTCATTARGAAFAIQAQGIAAFSVGVAQIRSSRLKQDDFQFWKNGVSLAVDASGLWPASPLTVLSLFSATGGAANFGKEKFYGGVIRSPVLSTTERQTVETYLAGKAGITL
jgi:hypothetical protein